MCNCTTFSPIGGADIFRKTRSANDTISIYQLSGAEQATFCSKQIKSFGTNLYANDLMQSDECWSFCCAPHIKRIANLSLGQVILGEFASLSLWRELTLPINYSPNYSPCNTCSAGANRTHIYSVHHEFCIWPLICVSYVAGAAERVCVCARIRS